MILLLSNADTELLAVRTILHRLPDGFPLVRAANPAGLDASSDIDGAELVVVRLLGGRAAWEAPFDALRAACRAAGVPFVAVGGEASPDPEMAAWSTVPTGIATEVHAGLDGVIAKPAAATYEPGKRAMIKIKHARTADCVVAGFRWHKSGKDAVGSLLLGLYDERGALQHVGVTSAFTMAARKALAIELAPLREHAMDEHPWREWAEAAGEFDRMPGGHSRWNAGKDLSWEPLRIERVCEVKYDHLQGRRFRHATIFLRWRPDESPDQ